MPPCPSDMRDGLFTGGVLVFSVLFSCSFFSFRKRKERTKEKKPYWGDLRAVRRTGRTRRCTLRWRGRMFFLFFREKSERTKEKKPYRGGVARRPSGGPHPSSVSRVLFRSFFSFRKRKERTKEKKPYRGEIFAQALGRPSSLHPFPVSHVLSVLSFLSEKERKNQRKETLTGRNLRAGLRAALLPLIGPANHALRAKIEPLTDARSGSC